MQVTRITDIGNDVALVEGTADDGTKYTARNWISALWNWYPPEAYDPETGNRYDPNAPGTDMPSEAIEEWAVNLLNTVGAPASSGRPGQERTDIVWYQAPAE